MLLLLATTPTAPHPLFTTSAPQLRISDPDPWQRGLSRPVCPPGPGQSRATRAHLELLAARLHPDEAPRSPPAFLGLQPEYLPQELVLGGVDQGEDVSVQHVPILLQEACGEAEPPKPRQLRLGRGG